MALDDDLRVVTQGSDNCVQHTGSVSATSVALTGAGNHVDLAASNVNGCNIVVTGDNNRVIVCDSTVQGMGVQIRGSNNSVRIEAGCVICSLGIVCEDNANAVVIGAHTEIAGATELAALEGTNLTIGPNCLFSRDVHFRTGDSHSLIDKDGNRINPSRDISLGAHVWVGMGVTILKGVSVADSCIIGAKSVVTRQFTVPHCCIAGNPAVVVRTDVDWTTERLSDSA